MANFSNIPSQFDNIVEGHPVVFISYSWDSDEHKAWVRKLADDLRTKYSINVLLDQYNRGGYDFLEFMKKGVLESDRVLLIGTPIYKEKSEKYSSGGVKYEDQLISAEIYRQMGTSKFIPVLRSGTFVSSFNSLIETRSGYLLVDDGVYDSVLFTLAADLWNNPENAAPALGPKPEFSNNHSSSRSLNSQSSNFTKEQFLIEVKRLLSTPYNEIPFTDLIENEAQRAYEIIISHARYDFIITPVLFKEYINIHFNAVENLLAASVVVVRFGTISQQQLFVKAMVKLCIKPIQNGEAYNAESKFLHLMASTFLFHAVGVACVRYSKFGILPQMLQEMAPAPNALSTSLSLKLARLAGVQHWNDSDLNKMMGSSWHYPFSHIIMDKLNPFFIEIELSKEDFTFLFAAWEHLFSLMFNYYGCNYSVRDHFPQGYFEHIRYSIKNIDYNFYKSFFQQAFSQKVNWTPIRDGLFDGSYEKFYEEYKKGEAYYKDNIMI